MKIIVCGAGQVGTTIARQLSLENNDVTVIDKSIANIQKINETLDVRAHIGFASHPTVLEEVNASDADMIIAVTSSDEVNMIACQIAHTLFDVPTKIARIRNQNYLNPEWSTLYRQDHLPIDFIISPEVAVAEAIINRLHVPGALDTIPLADGKVKVVGLRCTIDSPVINMSLNRVYEKCTDIDVCFLGIMREDEFIGFNEDAELFEDDEIYFSCDSNIVSKAMSLFGHEEREARRVIIIGGGNIGLYLAQKLEQDPEIKAKIIEIDPERAQYIAERLSRITVINGDALSQNILEESNVAIAETVVAVSNDDEVNILSSLLSKRFECNRVVTLINNANSYSPLISSLGIDVAVNPKEITVSGILQHIRKGQIVSVHSICKGNMEILEAEAIEASPIAFKSIEALNLPKGVVIGSIIRNNRVIFPYSKIIIQPKDHLIILSKSNMIKKVEEIFTVKFEYF